MNGHLLPVQILPGLVELAVDGRVEAQRRKLHEHADWRLDLLHERVRTADADIGLTADHRLGGDILGFQIGHLDIDTLFLGPLEGREEMQGFDAGDVAINHTNLGRFRCARCHERGTNRESCGAGFKHMQPLEHFHLPLF